MPSLYDPNAQLSTHYTLADFTKTNQALSEPNLPAEAYQFENLTYLADTKERLDHEIGPSEILSGFRTKELQNALTASGEPTGSGSMSFHETGRGIDIFPTTMSIADYFGRILANENLKSQFAEIAIKPSQNAIHLAINVPGDIREPKITGLTSEGIYARLNLDEIANYIAPFMNSLDDAYSYAEAKLVTWNKTPLIIGAGLLAGASLWILLSKKAKA